MSVYFYCVSVHFISAEFPQSLHASLSVHFCCVSVHLISAVCSSSPACLSVHFCYVCSLHLCCICPSIPVMSARFISAVSALQSLLRVYSDKSILCLLLNPFCASASLHFSPVLPLSHYYVSLFFTSSIWCLLLQNCIILFKCRIVHPPTGNVSWV